MSEGHCLVLGEASVLRQLQAQGQLADTTVQYYFDQEDEFWESPSSPALVGMASDRVFSEGDTEKEGVGHSVAAGPTILI